MRVTNCGFPFASPIADEPAASGQAGRAVGDGWGIGGMNSPYWDAVRHGKAQYWYRLSGAFITIFRHQGQLYRSDCRAPHFGRDDAETGLAVRERVPDKSIGAIRAAGTNGSLSRSRFVLSVLSHQRTRK